MSIKAITLVHERTRAKGSNLLALIAIADYAKDDGRGAFPSAATIAWKSRLSDRAAELIIRKLVQDGEVQPEWDETNHRLYLHIRCIFEWVPYQAEGPVPQRDERTGARRVRENFARSLVAAALSRRDTKLSSHDTLREDSCPLPEKSPVENTGSDGPAETSAAQPSRSVNDPIRDPVSTPPAAAGLVDRFNRFWFAYPKKVGKDAAWRAWKRRRPDGPLTAEIVAALERQREYLAREDGQYTPNPATWLNEGRWQDEPPAVRPRATRPFTATELADARQVLRARGGCPHDPTCENAQACVGSIIRQWRYQRGDAA